LGTSTVIDTLPWPYSGSTAGLLSLDLSRGRHFVRHDRGEISSDFAGTVDLNQAALGAAPPGQGQKRPPADTATGGLLGAGVRVLCWGAWPAPLDGWTMTDLVLRRTPHP